MFIRLLKSISPVIILVLLLLLFFNKTLTGEEMFITPDYGQADILHAEYASKDFSSKMLKAGKIPLWNPYNGNGYPHLAVPSGILNPIFLLNYYIFPMPQAENTGLFIVFLTAGLGIYFLLLSLTGSRFSALMSSISLVFSGIFVTKIVHFNVLQTFSYFPWEMYFLHLFFKYRKYYFLPLFSLALGFQFLSGFFQIVLYSVIIAVVYAVGRFYTNDRENKTNKTNKTHMATGLILAMVLGVGIGSVQLFPSLEFTGVSNRSGGLSTVNLREFPYGIKDLITFINPYILGDVRTGGYQKTSPSADFGIFWENTGYLGIIPLLIGVWAAVYYFRKNHELKIHAVSGIICLLLMLGFSTPLFVLYLFPPLSLFRLPVRFIMFLVFFLSVLFGIGISGVIKMIGNLLMTNLHIREKQVMNALKFILFILVIGDLLYFAVGYNLKARSIDVLAEPETVSFLRKDNSDYRVMTLGLENPWNDIFDHSGWIGKEEDYIGVLGGIRANWNSIYGIKSLDMYEAVVSGRYWVVRNAIIQDIMLKEGRFTVGARAKKLLDLYGINYLISPFVVEGSGWEELYKTSGKTLLYIYRNSGNFPPVFIAGKSVVISDLKQYTLTVDKIKDFTGTVMAESANKQTVSSGQKGQIDKVLFDGNGVRISGNFHDGEILVINQSFLPGWKAHVDGIRQNIIPVNLNMKGITMSSGRHEVSVNYEPESVKYGLGVTLASLVVTILSGVFFIYVHRLKLNE